MQRQVPKKATDHLVKDTTSAVAKIESMIDVDTAVLTREVAAFKERARVVCP